MDWQRTTNAILPVVKQDAKAEVSVPSTEGMPPLSDITKHKGKRRTRTGSLNAHYTVSELRERDNNLIPKMPPLTRIRRTPIAGGSWDDNSVGHGSVVSRMRRERNRAILRTQSSMTYPFHHSVDTHANVTSTLNLINTTSLSPLPSDSFHDNSEWLNNYLWDRTPHQSSAAAKSSAGSMCNIPVSGYQTQPWDTLSIPELHSTKSCDRTCHRAHHRHSYSSGLFANGSHLHSSPTSGCASIASSDLDSADFMYFNINDDSSYFDGDSLFADSLGFIGDNDTSFSTNILSLLEEGSISCRTPFPASDWPDSISELDFDCSEGKPEDVTNCDALSDIGPSCSSPPQRRRITKRQSMAHNKPSEVETNFDTDDDDVDDEIEQREDSDEQPSVTDTCLSELDDLNASTDSIIAKESQEPITPTEIPSSSISTVEPSVSLLTHPMTEMTWSSLTIDEKDDYVKKLTSAISQTLSPEEQFDVMQLLSPNIVSGTPHSGQISGQEVDFERLSIVLKHLEQRRRCVDCDWVLVKSLEQKNGTIKLVKQKKVLKYGTEVPSTSYRKPVSTILNTSDLGSSSNADVAKLRTLSNGSTKIFTEPAQKYYDTTKIMSDSARYYDDLVKPKLRCHRKFTLDETSAPLRQRVRPGSRQETSSTKSADPQHAESCSDPSCQGCSSNLRRSNSDGNLPKSLGAEAQKEHRRQQRHARRWAKWLKTRQRKEKHQLLKEHRSGLFLNERKVKLKVDCEEEVDIEIS